jgi:hypothetical protein
MCKNKDKIFEDEFKYPLSHTSTEKNKAIPSGLEIKSDIINNISSSNMLKSENILNKLKIDYINNNNIIGEEEIKSEKKDENMNLDTNNNNNQNDINENNNNDNINNNDINHEINTDNIKSLVIKRINSNDSIKSKNEKEMNNNIDNKSIHSNFFSVNKNDYNSRIINLINELRLNPSKYSKVVEENIQYIYKEVRNEVNKENGEIEEKEDYIFQKKVKVRLYEGENAFLRAANYLKSINPMNELIYKEEIKLDLPDNIEEIKNNNIIKEKIKSKKNISAFFKDNVKNPEIGLLLMIIGDYKNAQNKKRNTILNPEYKYIAVNSKFIGDFFVAFFTFSK